MELRIRAAGFEETCRLEDFDWTAAITLDRRLLDAVFSLEFLSRHEHVLLVGPAGVGKTFLAQARVDNSLDRTFRSFLSPDLLILDDLGLHKLTAQQSADLYELIIGRHRASSFVITSNRAVEEWLSLFDDPIPGNSALDRLANASFQIVIEGASYREKLSPHRKLLGGKGATVLNVKGFSQFQAGMCCSGFQGSPCLSMAFRMVSSLRMQAVRASFFGLPIARSRW